MTGEIRCGEDGPVALHTRFGWVLSSSMATASQGTSAANFITTHTLQVVMEPSNLTNPDDCLHSLWNVEFLGVSVEEDPLLEDNIRF